MNTTQKKLQDYPGKEIASYYASLCSTYLYKLISIDLYFRPSEKDEILRKVEEVIQKTILKVISD
jgi:hypothetical protein